MQEGGAGGIKPHRVVPLQGFREILSMKICSIVYVLYMFAQARKSLVCT